MQALGKKITIHWYPPCSYYRKFIFFLYNKIFSDIKPFAICSSFGCMARGFLFFFWKFYTFREIFTYCKNSSPRGDNNSVDFEKKDDGWLAF